MARRESLGDVLLRTLVTSAIASAASAAALMMLSTREGRGPTQPINASSHWVHGTRAGRKRGTDLAHTGIGLITHHLATMWWSFLLEKWLGPRPRTLPEMALAGGSTAALAALVDYGLMPRRLSPGWELALTRKSMAGAFSAMAVGLAAGAFAARGARKVSARRR